MRISKIFCVSLLYAFSIIFLIEGVTRLFFKITHSDIDAYRNFTFQKNIDMFMPDPILGYRLIPDISRTVVTSEYRVVYKTNGIGLREKEIEYTDKFKILFLGDSMTFGEGIPYGSRFSDIVERDLRNVYAINAAVPGYGIHQMYLWLRESGMDLRPYLVVCPVISTDLARSIYKEIKSSPYLLIAEQENLVQMKTIPAADYFGDMADRLLAKSYFYSVVKTRINIALMSRYLKERDSKFWDEIRKKGDYAGDHYYKITTAEQKEMIRRESRKIFLGFKELCDQKRVKFLVVNIDTRAIPGLSDFLKEQEIDYLDLSQPLSKTPRIKFTIDPHYNAAGNIVIARLLEDYIAQHYLAAPHGLEP